VGWRDGVAVHGLRPDGTAEEVGFRDPLPQQLQGFLFVPLGAFVGMALQGTFLVQNPGTVAMPFAAAALGGSIGALIRCRNSVRLTPEGLVVTRFGSGSCLAWSQIEGFTVRRVLGSRVVLVHRADGRKTKLPVPIGGFLGDRNFDRKYHTIGQWWLNRR
jgi:hypothetical protein